MLDAEELISQLGASASSIRLGFACDIETMHGKFLGFDCILIFLGGE